MRAACYLTAAAVAAGGHCELLSSTQASGCHDFDIPITASAQNRILPQTLNFSDLTTSFLNTVVAGLPTAVQGGHYTISARYCEPENHVAKRQNTLQVLVHGITYDKNYWSGLAPPGTLPGQDYYSWLKYASGQGYPTLSIDRLCNGKSSKPNGLTACQIPLQAGTMHGVIEKARTGELKGVDRKFSKIVYVGHSYGSLVANALAIEHPDDVDSYIMSGFSTKLAQGSPGVLFRPDYKAAKQVKPKKYHDLNDPTYTVATKKTGAKHVFYYGKYKMAELELDWDQRGTVTKGEFATALIGQQTASDYSGSLFILNGNGDNIFCSNPVSASTGSHGACDKGKFDQYTKGAYPNARKFAFHNTADTGHCLNLHETAQESFKAAHEFLRKDGF